MQPTPTTSPPGRAGGAAERGRWMGGDAEPAYRGAAEGAASRGAGIWIRSLHLPAMAPKRAAA